MMSRLIERRRLLLMPKKVATGGGGGGPTATFDGVPSGVTLSNGNLTATLSTLGNSGARTAVTKAIGKYYCEFTITLSRGGADGAGLLVSTGSYTDMLNVVNCIYITRSGGIVYSFGAAPGVAFGDILAGGVVGVASDLTTRMVWIRVGASLWNANAAHNPATAAGGISIPPTVALGPALLMSYGGTTIGDNMTANFGATAYANAAPSGFLNWPAT